MKFPFYIAKRYLFTKSSNNAINIISRIASLGVVFGSMLLLIILSGFAGLKTFTLSYVSSIDPDFKIFPKSGKRIFVTPEQLNKLDKNSNIVNYSKIVEEKVFLEFKGITELGTIKGVDANYISTVPVDSLLTLGQWLTPQSAETVMGQNLAYKLKLGVFDFDNLKLIVPKAGKSQSIKNSINTEFVKNVGQISVNDVYNNEYVFSSLELAQKLLSFDANSITNIEFKTIPNIDEELFREELNTVFNNSVNIKNKAQLNDAIHKMLNTENIAVYLIFTLILIIAMFNLIGSIIMMIIDKKRDLMILSNLGTPISDIKQIFFLQGVSLTFIGGTIGVVLGVLLVSAQLYFEFITIPGIAKAYPVELNIMNILLVMLTIYSLGIIASKIASYRISKKMLNVK